MHAHTHEVIPCTTDPNTKWEPCTAAEAAVMRMLGYPVREVQEDNAAPRDAWRPIDSAPRDGSPILACYAPQYASNGFLPVCVRWRSYHPNAQGKEAFRTSSGIKAEHLTHWLPLPPPPVATGVG